MLKKLLASSLVLFLILPLMISCSAENASETILVPGTANMVVKVLVGKILNNTTFQTAYDELAKKNPELPQTLNEVLNQLVQKTGFDFASISTAVFFSDIESTSPKQNTYSGMIASGTFNESTFIARIEQETQQKLTTSDYKGLTVYAGAQNEFEMVFLSQSQLAFGTPLAIRDVVDVSKRDKPALNGSIIDTLNRFGPALIVGASVPPESVLNQLGKEVPVPQKITLSLNSLQDIDNIGFSIDQPSISLSVRLDLHFSNATSARDAKDTITGFILVAKGTSQNANVKTALGKIEVSMTDSWLSIRDIVTPADIGNLTGSMQTQK